MTSPDPFPVMAEPIDPDIQRSAPAPKSSPMQGQGPVVCVVAIGGALGACARYGAGLLWPTAPGAFPWTTFAVNAVGCAVIGVLMVVITERWNAHRLVRPFFGTGVLGGFTTFSTYTVDIHTLIQDGHAETALAYLVATPLIALAAVWSAATATRRLIAGRQT
ncbi:fluoride efflux transporter CrcB [Streptomyces sp. MI02-7b]|uniref:fluoride efflux transporter CrcB n=1 Tax=Streptomyces sp. MI02-7b TaxID=462941 RepID=UPI0029A6F970|nr:fluoride efflux transporter CrcB [Streptomyces sp. MI02-7b]MDX3076992.1 fluoride efflux transporter CrcB [Streptomyces sp. MI02-7b]